MVEQAQYKQILDSLTTAVIVLDYQLRVMHLNAAAEALMSVSREHHIGRSFKSCFSPDEKTPEILVESLKNNQSFTKRQAHWKLHNNQEITSDYTVAPAPELGQVTIEVQPLDRLLRISREEAWISSQETSKNLVRSLAHEIKNPLGGIRGAAQLLAREFDNQEFDEYTRIIIDETDRLRNLVDRMLGPRNPPQFNEINIHEVLEHVASVMSLQTQGKVDITRDYDPSIPDVQGDRTQLIQAFMNIVSNAIQALTEDNTQTEPTVVLTTRVMRRYTIGRINHPLVIRVSVTDNGPGIPLDIIDDIFFPMITGRAEGSGLGLSISQNLIGQHRGLIECNSEPGKTEFAIYLPLGTDNAQL